VAKRSVKKARTRDPERGTQAPRSDARGESLARSRGFWLGALASAAVLVPLAVVAVLAFGGNEDEPAAVTSPTEGAEGDAAELRRQFAERDKQQIEELTERARSMVDDFAPVIAGLGQTLPPDS
jgi:hypothetical protein